MRGIEVQQGQWTGDVAIGAIGAIDRLLELCFANNLSITAPLENGAKLQPIGEQNSIVTSYFSRRGLIPASSDYQSDKIKGTGIGHMTITIDFVVNESK